MSKKNHNKNVVPNNKPTMVTFTSDDYGYNENLPTVGELKQLLQNVPDNAVIHNPVQNHYSIIVKEGFDDVKRNIMANAARIPDNYVSDLPPVAPYAADFGKDVPMYENELPPCMVEELMYRDDFTNIDFNQIMRIEDKAMEECNRIMHEARIRQLKILFNVNHHMNMREMCTLVDHTMN